MAADPEQEEWQRRLEEIPPKKIDRSTWPKGVRGLSLDEMAGMGVDKDAMIYWHGEPVQIRQTLQLRTLELSLLAVAAIGAALQGVAAMFPFIPKMIAMALGYAV